MEHLGHKLVPTWDVSVRGGSFPACQDATLCSLLILELGNHLSDIKYPHSPYIKQNQTTIGVLQEQPKETAQGHSTGYCQAGVFIRR